MIELNYNEATKLAEVFFYRLLEDGKLVDHCEFHGLNY